MQLFSLYSENNKCSYSHCTVKIMNAVNSHYKVKIMNAINLDRYRDLEHK